MLVDCNECFQVNKAPPASGLERGPACHQPFGIAGALLGGSQGLIAAAKVRPEIGPDTARLKVNRLLNMTGTRGRTAGNALGVLGLLFAGMESGLGYLNDGSVPDAAATVAAGQHVPNCVVPCCCSNKHSGGDRQHVYDLLW